jgi:hypothetical protein
MKDGDTVFTRLTSFRWETKYCNHCLSTKRTSKRDREMKLGSLVTRSHERFVHRGFDSRVVRHLDAQGQHRRKRVFYPAVRTPPTPSSCPARNTMFGCPIPNHLLDRLSCFWEPRRSLYIGPDCTVRIVSNESSVQRTIPRQFITLLGLRTVQEMSTSLFTFCIIACCI